MTTPTITDVRQIPGAAQAGEFMLHAIQQLLDARGETRELFEAWNKSHHDFDRTREALERLTKQLYTLSSILERVETRLDRLEQRELQLAENVERIWSHLESLDHRVTLLEGRKAS